MAIDKLKELREDRNRILQEMRDLNDLSHTESRNFSDEENEKYSKMEKDFEDFESRIGRQEKLENTRDVYAEVKADFKDKTGEDLDNKEYARLFDKWARTGKDSLDASERAILRAQSIGTDSAGGYTVPDIISNQIITSMKQFGGMREHATVLNTSKGEAIEYPTVNDTTNVGALLAENAAVNNQDIAFGVKTLNAYKYESKQILVSRELLNDSYFDLDSYIREALATRLGRITNTHYTTGDGSSKPNGVATAASAGKTAAATSAITFDEIYDLMDSVDPAYEMNARFSFNKSTLTAIRKLKDGDSQYLWNPGDPVSGAAATIAGKPYFVNQDLASIGSGAKPILYGDFSKYVIRDVRGIELFRLDELYMANYQTGFIGFLRTDGELMDTAAVKYLRNVTT